MGIVKSIVERVIKHLYVNAIDESYKRGIRHVPYAWVVDCRSEYVAKYPSWDIDTIF